MKCIFLITGLLLMSFGFTQDTLPPKNKEVIKVVEKYGPLISPTYESAVCTELVIGVLGHLITLDSIDKARIRIIIDEDVYDLKREGSPLPKGVYNALISKGCGLAIDDWSKVLPGDFVQFWYPNSWGHCGIVKSVDLKTNTMLLYSSFPSTGGYGIQEFKIPKYTYFVRLK